MSRVTSRGTVSQRYAARLMPDGTPMSVYVNDSIGGDIHTTRRSDIIRNPILTDGWRPPSPYSATVTSGSFGYVRMITALRENGQQFVNEGKVDLHHTEPAYKIGYSLLNASYPPQNDIAVATILARNNVADRVASFSESLVELIQTMETLKGLAQRVNLFIEAALGKNWKGVADTLGIPRKGRRHRRAIIRYNNLGIPTVSNAFLCWNFGLEPIISDMVSLAILLGQGKDLRIVGKALRGHSDGAIEKVVYDHTMAYASGSGYRSVFHRSIKAGTYVRLDYEVSIEALRDLTSYGLLDAPATIWAVAPYSWLVDFVLPVSTVLRSLTATFGLSFKGGSATQFVKINDSYVGSTPVVKAHEKLIDFHAVIDDLEGMKMDRTIFESDPNPITLWVKDPLRAFPTLAVFSLLGKRLRLN